MITVIGYYPNILNKKMPFNNTHVLGMQDMTNETGFVQNFKVYSHVLKIVIVASFTILKF